MDDRRSYTGADIERQLTAAGQQLSALSFADVVPAAMSRIRALPRGNAVPAERVADAPARPSRRNAGMQPPIPQRTRRRELLRVALAACAVLLIGATLTVLTNRPDSRSGQPDASGEPAPFEIPGYAFEGSIALAPYGEGDRPPFPADLALGADGAVYVGDAAAMRVLALNRDGTLRFEMAVGDPPEPGQLDELYERLGQDWSEVARAIGDGRLELAAARDGTLYLSAVLGGPVYKIAPDGRVLYEWKPQIDFNAGLITAGIIAADNAGNVYYSERQSCTIGVLRADGSMGRLVGLEDCGQTWIEDLAVVGDRLYVAMPSGDVSGVEIPTFDLAGQPTERIQAVEVPDIPGNAHVFPVRVVIDQEGNLLVLTFSLVGREGQPPLTHVRLLTISPAGNTLAVAKLPTTKGWVEIAVAPDGTLGILYRDSLEVLLFEPAR